MPQYVLRVEINEKDVDKITALETLTKDNKRKESNARIVAERVRTIDQIKRLYAVVMGYALTTAIANAYLCERALMGASWQARSILIAPVISLVSIMVLFFLGAERLLDRKYLQYDSLLPSRFGLLTDLMTLGITAGLFVILANIFQAPPAFSELPPQSDPSTPAIALPPRPRLSLDDLLQFQNQFMYGLFFLYSVDAVLLAIQGSILHRSWRTLRNRPCEDENAKKVLEKMKKRLENLGWWHGIWFTINLLTMALLFFVFLDRKDWEVSRLEISGIASCLIVIHVVRFLADYILTFDAYYPPEPVEP